jgi:hypothetical protein
MSEWLTILEARGTVGGSHIFWIMSIVNTDHVVVGNALGGLYGCVATYEDILSSVSSHFSFCF